METKVFLGKNREKTARLENGLLDTNLPPQLELSMPVMFSAMSYGSISYNAHEALALAASDLGILYNTGEGGLHEDFTVMEKIRSCKLLPVALVFTKNIWRLGRN